MASTLCSCPVSVDTTENGEVEALALARSDCPLARGATEQAVDILWGLDERCILQEVAFATGRYGLYG